MQPTETTAEVEQPAEDLDLALLIQHPALRLCVFEQQCAQLWLLGWTEREIFEHVYPDWEDLRGHKLRQLEREGGRRIRRALNRAAERVAVFRPVKAAGWDFARVLVQCVRNRKQEAGPQDLVGLLPTIYLDDPNLTVPEYNGIVGNPENYRNVAMRSPLISTGMAAQRDRDSLRHLASGLGL